MNNNPFRDILLLLLKLKDDQAIIKTEQNLETFFRLIEKVEMYAKIYDSKENLENPINDTTGIDTIDPITDIFWKEAIKQLMEVIFNLFSNSS